MTLIKILLKGFVITSLGAISFVQSEKLKLKSKSKTKIKIESNNKKVYKYGVWNKNAYYDYKLLEELSTISFYGREYSTPGKTSEYLEAKYGDDWKIPRENWNVVIDDKSISRQENQS